MQIHKLIFSLPLFGLLTLNGPNALADGSTGTGGNTFCNPLNVDYRFSISSPFYREAADPCVITFKNEYYLFASHSSGYWWSTNFRDWNLVVPSGLDIEKRAPSVIVISNTLYYTSSQAGDIYKTTDPKGGKWTYVSHPHDWGDPAMFVDDDGSVYCYYGCSAGGSINVVQLDPAKDFRVIGKEIKCFFSDPKNHGFEVFGEANTQYDKDTWIEGAWMTKFNGTYYLQYAVPATQLRSYCDAVYKSASPTGPFVFCTNNPVTAKPRGFVTGTGHGCTFQDLQGKYWRADTVTLSVNHMFERRLTVFPAGFDADGSMYSDTVMGDYPQYLPGQGRDPITNNLRGWNLLSKGKAVAASSQHGSFAATNAVDEDIRTWWCAATGDSGEWLSIDLGKQCTIDAIQVNFADQDGNYFSGRATPFCYKYKVECSTDGVTWKMLLDKSANNRDYPDDYTELGSPAVARSIKITNLGRVPGNGKFAISDLRLFGSGGSVLPDEVKSVTVRRDKDSRSAKVSWGRVAGAEGYIIRYGAAATKLYNHCQVWSQTSYAMNSLIKGQDYYFTVDAFNDGGVRKGVVVVPAPAQYVALHWLRVLAIVWPEAGDGKRKRRNESMCPVSARRACRENAEL
jgi:hypothetical protein